MGWQTGFVTRLDMGTANPGALLIGSKDHYRRSRIAGRTRGWSLDEADAPVLGALVAAVGSAMRAGAAFNALSEETAKLTAVVDNTSDGIAMVDDAGPGAPVEPDHGADDRRGGRPDLGPDRPGTGDRPDADQRLAAPREAP